MADFDEMREIAQQREEDNEFKEKRRQEHLREIKEDDPWKFMTAWTCGTGEGSTYCLYMTATYDEEVARKRFAEKFGDYYSNWMDFTTREIFFDMFSDYIPKSIKELSNKPCSLEFYTEVHYSFS